MIREATTKNALFAGLTSSQSVAVVAAMFAVDCTDGQVVIEQDDHGDNFYVVDSGEFAVLIRAVGDKPVHHYSAGGTFGELALMYNTPRAATVKATKPGRLWAVDRSTFRKVLEDSAAEASTLVGSIFDRSCLSVLTEGQRSCVFGAFVERVFSAGETIVKQGDDDSALYVVQDGDVASFANNERSVMSKGACFGEGAISSQQLAKATQTVTAEKRPFAPLPPP